MRWCFLLFGLQNRPCANIHDNSGIRIWISGIIYQHIQKSIAKEKQASVWIVIENKLKHIRIDIEKNIWLFITQSSVL